MIICQALRRLCSQNRAVLAAAGETAGFADPYSVGDAEEEAAAANAEELVHLEVPASYTTELARR